MASGSSSSNGKPGPGASAIVRALRQAKGLTRAALMEKTGLSRSTVSEKLDRLIAVGLVGRGESAGSTGGRPSGTLVFREDAGVVLAADLGATHCRVALTDLEFRPLAEHEHEVDIADGPQAILPTIAGAFAELLRQAKRKRADVWGIGIGVPGPVEFSTGRPVSPPIMPGWDGFDIPSFFRGHLKVPVVVDNDVNVMAMGEHRAEYPNAQDLLFIKVGTGIGCGIIANGAVYRGAQGAAGDIGHIQIETKASATCRCGNPNCLEAFAGGDAIAAALRKLGVSGRGSRDVVKLVRAGQADAVRLVREAGRLVGQVTASLVNFFNPERVILGGALAESGAELIAGIREVVYRRSLALATRKLEILPSRLAERSGITGAACLVVDRGLLPENLEERLRNGR